jgi:hypothetical protein
MNSRLLLMVVVLAALALLALIGLQRALEEAVREREATPPAQENAPAVPEGEAGGDAAKDAEAGKSSSNTANDDSATCLSYAEARRDPGFRQELLRVRRAGLLNDDLESYRHLDDRALESLADTGDAAAMVVLGQRRLLAGQGRDPDLAVDLLAMTAIPEHRDPGPIDLDGLDRALLDEAADWFYRAALHGRIYALQGYGHAVAWREGLLDAPPRLGWVDEAAWEGMTTKQRQILWNPPNVYAEAVYDLAPALTTGISGVAYEVLLAKTDETQTVRDGIVRRFLTEQQKAGLPALEIPLSDFDMEDFQDSLCAGVSDRLERDGFR